MTVIRWPSLFLDGSGLLPATLRSQLKACSQRRTVVNGREASLRGGSPQASDVAIQGGLTVWIASLRLAKTALTNDVAIHDGGERGLPRCGSQRRTTKTWIASPPLQGLYTLSLFFQNSRQPLAKVHWTFSPTLSHSRRQKLETQNPRGRAAGVLCCWCLFFKFFPMT